MTTTAPDEVTSALKNLIPYDLVGPGQVANPQYVARLFVAGNWAEIQVDVSQDPTRFSVDGSIYECRGATDFSTKADNVLCGRRADENE